MSAPRTDEHRALRIVLGTLHPEPPAELVETIRGYGAKAWALAAAAALRVHQEPLFHQFLRQHAPEAPLDTTLTQQLNAQRLLHAFRWEELRECLAQIVETLARHGIRPVLLKGASFVGDLYNPGRLRPMRDLDLLVRKDELAAADGALAEDGFRQSKEAELYAGHHHLPPRFHPESGVCIEVHHRPLSEGALLPGVPPLTTFWEGLRDSRAFETDTGVAAASPPAVLDPTLSLLVTCLHFTHGEHIGWRIGQLVDVARLVASRGAEIDWERLLGWAEESAIAASVGCTVGFLADWGFPGVPERQLRELRRAGRLRRWERRLLSELTVRYRIGTPPPWRGVSMRIGNILWSETLRRASILRRSAATLNRIVSRGKKSWRKRQSRRAEEIAARPSHAVRESRPH